MDHLFLLRGRDTIWYVINWDTINEIWEVWTLGEPVYQTKR